MNRILPVLFFCALVSAAAQDVVTFPEDLSYDPFYAVKVTDSEGAVYILSNSAFMNPEGELKYFVWFRRGTREGLAEYPLDLFKIRRLELTGNYEIPPDGYTPCKVELTSGKSFEGFLDTTGYLGGMDQDFGVYARLYLNYNALRSVEFLHDGTYRRCPFCGALFYNLEQDTCPFDQTELVEQHPKE